MACFPKQESRSLKDLIRFCLAQADPWLSVLIAIPYMVIVVAMGYTRQAVALGILMVGLAAVPYVDKWGVTARGI